MHGERSIDDRARDAIRSFGIESVQRDERRGKLERESTAREHYQYLSLPVVCGVLGSVSSGIEISPLRNR